MQFHGDWSLPLNQKSAEDSEIALSFSHGRKHSLNPTEVNYRANIRAMKKLGVTHILATTCCGSLREEMKPGDFVVLDSFIDRWVQLIHNLILYCHLVVIRLQDYQTSSGYKLANVDALKC